jgi:transposase
MDNCRIHDKIAIYLFCARFKVLCVFLPSYSPDYSPIENMFNCTRMLMQQLYGSETIVSVENVFRECLWSSVTPAVACIMFTHCFFT